MKIVFFGTNGWYNTKTGNTICTFIDTDKCYIVLDAGDGLFKLDSYIKEPKPIYIFLSHLHMDHITGLHILNKFCFTQGVTIYLYQEYLEALINIIGNPFTKSLNKLPYKVDCKGLNEGKHVSPFIFETRCLEHTSLSIGYRFELEGKIVTYCADTQYCSQAIELARNSDILITESSILNGMSESVKGHLTPEQAALLASKSGTSQLYLTHFEARSYPGEPQRKQAEISARKVFSSTTAALDDMEIFL